MVVAAKRHMNLKTTAEAEEAVKTVLAQSPRSFGHETNLWTVETIQQTISWLQDCTKSGAWQVLKRLGFSRQKALAFIRSPDPLFQQKVRCIKQAFSHALWHPEQAVLLFQDEMSFEQQPVPATTWGGTGDAAPQVTRQPTGNALTRVAGAMDGITGQLFYDIGAQFGVKKMRQLYHTLRDHYEQRYLYVVQDNWPSVHKHPSVLQTARELHVTPLFLPTYASWLNPIEKLWRWLRADVLYNHDLAHSLPLLRQSVSDFLDQFASGSHDLLHYVGLYPD